MQRQDSQNSAFVEQPDGQDGTLKKPWHQQLRPFQLAAIDQTERLWQVHKLVIMLNTAACQQLHVMLLLVPADVHPCATSAIVTGYAQCFLARSALCNFLARKPLLAVHVPSSFHSLVC